MSRLAALVTSFVLLFALAVPAARAGEDGAARLRLIGSDDTIRLVKYGRGPVRLELGIYLASLDAPFEIRLRRASYDDPVRVWQVRRGANVDLVPLPADVVDGWSGFAGFFEIEIADLDGQVLRQLTAPFCPGGWAVQRVTDTGPLLPTYPYGCWSHPFMLGSVWGVDEGWAVDPASSGDAPHARLREGRYRARVSIAPRFVELFGVAPEDASVEVGVRVVTNGGCGSGCYAPEPRSTDGGRRRLTPAPMTPKPDPSTVPDLVAQPSFGISIQSRRHRDFLAFGANVWNGGSRTLIVEGFRRPGEDVMDAYQYFLDGRDRVVGRAPVGTFEFDDRHSHGHWHFQQFAGYRLLDASQVEAVRSRKESFCLAPTDPLDLTLRGAMWRPDELGFSACGGPTALWIRETLPVGWGDTYYQWIPGQSFDITDLPNGTYFIEVHANPLGLLLDLDPSNDVSLREIVLGGRPGSRTVTVPPWHGIETEGWF